MKFNIPQRYLDEKLISVQKHPDLSLFICNYTHKCQFERKWDDITMMCRGLILDGDCNIVAKPFSKFFNLDEYVSMGNELPTSDFEVYDKLDGSLGIVYFDPQGSPHIATRGSFTSDQAIKATTILHSKYPLNVFSNRFTYLFEIIYPANRIVVDYKGVEDIYLLAVIETDTGIELSYDKMQEIFRYVFPIVKRFDGIGDVQEVKNLIRENAEGVVVKWANGLRVKVKYDEYVRLHRLVTGINAKRIWEHLKDNQPLDELLERVPDEFYKWVTETTLHLKNEYEIEEKIAQDICDKIKNLPTRKEQAQALMVNEKDRLYSGIVFKMLDQHDYSEVIWKRIRPVAEKPFKEDIDA